jgi:clan AA aspartic protease
MIEGQVRATRPDPQTEILQAFIPLVVHSLSGRRWEGEAIVDTGFSDGLALDPDAITTLGLQSYGVERRQMANGLIVLIPIYEAVVQWHGKSITLRVLGMERTLAGAGLLKGCAVSVDMVAEGRVVIRELS